MCRRMVPIFLNIPDLGGKSRYTHTYETQQNEANMMMTTNERCVGRYSTCMNGGSSIGIEVTRYICIKSHHGAVEPLQLERSIILSVVNRAQGAHTQPGYATSATHSTIEA